MAATALLVVSAPAEAKVTTRADLERKGYKCERIGIGGYECKISGDKWFCPNEPLGECIDLPGVVVPFGTGLR